LGHLAVEWQLEPRLEMSEAICSRQLAVVDGRPHEDVENLAGDAPVLRAGWQPTLDDECLPVERR
jgi:hypothetical protein